MFEFTAGEGVDVHDDGVALQVPRPAEGGNGAAAGQGQGQITGRLLIDCMGNFSPIVRQVRKACLRQRPCSYRIGCAILLVVNATLIIIATPWTAPASARLQNRLHNPACRAKQPS